MSLHFSRDAHFYYEIFTFLCAWTLGITCIYVVTHKTPRYLKSYSKMIVLNTMVDLFFSLISLILMGTLDVRSGLLYIVIDNPYHPNNHLLGAFSSSLWTFALYLTVVALPMQFIYRYGIVCRSKPYSGNQIRAMIFGFILYVGLHAALCPVTMHNKSKEYDDILNGNPIFHGNLPNAYLVGDSRTFNANTLHVIHCQIILIVSYILIVSFGYKTVKKLKQRRAEFSEEKAMMQAEITWVMILQAIYPVIALAIPLFFLGAVPLLTKDEDQIDVSWLGMVGIGLVNLIPIFNALSVLLVVPPYRRSLFGCSD